MTDLEMTKLCAEAMVLRAKDYGDPDHRIVIYETRDNVDIRPLEVYDPLHDDAQAMALVKKFGLELTPPQLVILGRWCVRGGIGSGTKVHHETDLNRAIVECVAKMQGAKP